MRLLDLITALNREGWNAALAAPGESPLTDLLKKTGTRVEIDKSFNADPARENLRLLCRQYDLVVANTINSWPAVEAAHAEDIPAVWYIHETLSAVRLIKQVPKVKDTLDLARLIVVPTKHTARHLKDATRTKIETLSYGIADVAGAKSTAGHDAVSFVSLEPFEPRQGQDVLLDAIARLDPEIRKRTLFKMAGPILDRQFFTQLKTRVAKTKNVELIESARPDESAELLRNSGAFISFSQETTMPIALLEAASLGKAMIASDAGGIGEWIHDGLNGWLVPVGDAVQLAAAITRCAQDRQLRERLGAAARRTYERHFTLDRFTNEFAALLDELSKQNGKGALPAEMDYARWIAAFDDESATTRLDLLRKVRRLPRHPLISILLPVYNPDLPLLQVAVDSVTNQIYPHWELCIAEDASTDANVRPFLEAIARRDSRIKITFRKSNGHIAACSNSALGLATGEWCGLLDQDDALSEKALAFVAQEITDHSQVGLIYSDEDKIDNQGARSSPYFKSDWNPELLLGQNYINHLVVYRTAMLRHLDGFREGFEGSQDYDLVLRCTEQLRPEQIRHIPRVLYHWRMVGGSVAKTAEAKPYAIRAARRALAEHLQRCNISGRVEACPEVRHQHRVIYDLPDVLPLVSVIVPTRDRVDLLEQCVRSLRAETDYPHVELIIVDNESVDPRTHQFLEHFERQPLSRVLREPGVFNFSRLNNAAVRAARAELVLFLNSDVTADGRDWLHEMVRALQPEVAAVGARLWYPNRTLQHGGVIVGLGGIAGVSSYRTPQGHPGYFNRVALPQNYSAVTAACMLVRKNLFEEIGGFDEVNLGINFNDVDFCLRLRKRGWQIVWTPYANLIHHESASRGHHATREEQAQFRREARYMQQKWGTDLLCDPFYTPNFSLNFPGFDLAFPPREQSCAEPGAVAA